MSSAAHPSMDSAGAKSTVSRDIEELTQGKEQTSKTVQGHKANLANPSKQSTSHPSQPIPHSLSFRPATTA